MDNYIFVNEAFTNGLNDYLNFKDNPECVKYNSFLVIVVRLLTIIYDELDILNPFYLDNERSLDTNLMKYGYSLEKINDFKKVFQKYYENEGESNFIKIQKMLIDMFALKKLNQKAVIAKPKETLSIEAYEILKYSLEDIKAMNSDELDAVNKEVYNYFDINANAINKKYLLDKAVFDYNHPKPSLSTGNGYVDILFFLAITATIGMVILIITLTVL